MERFDLFDAFKGFAIIVVALYHFGPLCLSSGTLFSFRDGVLPYGYLGVDVFFIISGFFFI